MPTQQWVATAGDKCINHIVIEDVRAVSNPTVELAAQDGSSRLAMGFGEHPMVITGLSVRPYEWTSSGADSDDNTQLLTFESFFEFVDSKPAECFTLLNDGPCIRVGHKEGEWLKPQEAISALANAARMVGQFLAVQARVDNSAWGRLRCLLDNPMLASMAALAWLNGSSSDEHRRLAEGAAKGASDADRDQLVAEIAAEIQRLVREMYPQVKEFGDTYAVEDDGLPRWDAWLARRLDELGDKTDASDFRSQRQAKIIEPRCLWELWLPSKPGGLPSAVQALAHALWKFKVLPALERAQKNRPALVVPVMASVVDFHSRSRDYDANSGQLTFAGREIARTISLDGPVQIDLGVLEHGLGLLGSTLSHQILRYEVFEAHRRWLAHETYPNILEIEGGWTGFAERLGCSPKKHAAGIRDIVYAQAHFRFAFPDGSKGNMLSYNEGDARGRNGKAHITLTIGSPLLPGYVHTLQERMGKADPRARQAQRLVPMPRILPPFYGRPNEHGQQASLALAFMTAFREKAAELASHGSVRLTFDDLTSLADRVALRRRLLIDVVAHWQHDVGDTPAFLKQPEPDRYTLADAHSDELDFIIEAGKRELLNSKRGKASARKRASEAIRAASHK